MQTAVRPNDAVRARRAATLKEAIALLDPDDPTVRPIAGGTALMLMMKAGVFRPEQAREPARRQGAYVD